MPAVNHQVHAVKDPFLLALGVGEGDVLELELSPEGLGHEGSLLTLDEGLSVDDSEYPFGG